MLLSKDKSQGQYEIKSYSPGKVTVNEKIYTESLIITAQTLIDDWKPQRFSDLCMTDFDIIFSLKPEIILLGTGEKMYFLSADMMNKIISQKIGIELMNNAAACRTFNVLMSEGRNALLALLLRD